jgi:hypothetical protein
MNDYLFLPIPKVRTKSTIGCHHGLSCIILVNGYQILVLLVLNMLLAHLIKKVLAVQFLILLVVRKTRELMIK